MSKIKLVVKKRYAGRIKSGYPWVYRSWIEKLEGNVSKGQEVCVYSPDDRFLGMAYINPDSQISARIYSRKEEPLSYSLLYSRLEAAGKLRRKFIRNSNVYRLFFSEADGLPGLIVDYYNGVVVFQILTFGLDLKRDIIVSAIDDVFSPDVIVERMDVNARLQEGLTVSAPKVYKGADRLKDGKVLVEENGIKFMVDVFRGHKTGHYIDQRENRLAVSEYVRGGRVLDCFCNTGGFGIYALAKGGADEVISIDIADQVLKAAEYNARINGVIDYMTFVKGNVFDHLRALVKRGLKFDVVILDPPSFTKSRKTLKNAIKGYKDINVKALKLLKKGGVLVTASCSYHVTLDIFMKIIKDALEDTRRKARILDIRYQAKDHPIIMELPESLYLKLVIMEVD